MGLSFSVAVKAQIAIDHMEPSWRELIPLASNRHSIHHGCLCEIWEGQPWRCRQGQNGPRVDADGLGIAADRQDYCLGVRIAGWTITAETTTFG